MTIQKNVSAIKTPLTAVFMAVALLGLSSVAQAAMSIDESIMTAVPEPETYLMMLVGLGLVGFVARRRQSIGKSNC